MQIKIKLIPGNGANESHEFDSFRTAISFLVRREMKDEAVPDKVHAEIEAIPEALAKEGPRTTISHAEMRAREEAKERELSGEANDEGQMLTRAEAKEQRGFLARLFRRA